MSDQKYIQPRTPFQDFVFRWRICFESTFALSMLQTWEKLLVVTAALLVGVLLTTSIYTYLPHHLHFLKSRAIFYFMGDERAAL